MTKLFNGDFCYQIHAQFGKEILVIRDSLSKNYFIKSASEILSDFELLAGFSPQEAALIGVIAGMAINSSNKS